VQTIQIIQYVQGAIDRVDGASGRLIGYKDHLDRLVDTIFLVQKQKELQTKPIEDQLKSIKALIDGYKSALDDIYLQTQKSKTKQYMHAMSAGDKEQKTIDTLMQGINRAMSNLTIQIQTTNVGLSGSLQEGFEVALPIVRRVDSNVQEVLNQNLAIATYIQGLRLDDDRTFCFVSFS
jgi:hypothetical protein